MFILLNKPIYLEARKLWGPSFSRGDSCSFLSKNTTIDFLGGKKVVKSDLFFELILDTDSGDFARRIHNIDVKNMHISGCTHSAFRLSCGFMSQNIIIDILGGQNVVKNALFCDYFGMSDFDELLGPDSGGVGYPLSADMAPQERSQKLREGVSWRPLVIVWVFF